MKYGLLALIAPLSLVGCASMTPTVQTESAHVTMDVQPSSIDRSLLLDNVTKAVQTHMSAVRVSREIPPRDLPEKPGKFYLKDPFAGSNMGALIGPMKMPVCEDAILTISSSDTTMQQYGDKTSFFLCVQPYKLGYNINIYSTFTKASGGISPTTLGATLASSLVGDSRQFIPRAMNEVRTAVENIGGKVVILDSYIPDSFKGPMVDQVGSLKK